MNYGAELTVQKYFDKAVFFLFSATVYDSKYVGSDGIERNTSYNGTYIANGNFGKTVGYSVQTPYGTKVLYFNSGILVDYT